MKIRHTRQLLAAAFTCALASITVAAARADDTGTAPMDTSTDASGSAPTMPPAANADAWKFGVTIPLWAPQINGNVTVLGHKQDANVNFSELKDHLDTSLSLALNAQKGKLGVFGNVGYMRFSGSALGPFGKGVAKANWGLKFVMANAGLSYLLVKTDNDHPFILNGTAGIRYWYADTRLDITDPNNSGATLFSHDNTYDLVDPVIGLRASQYLTQKLHVDVGGDGGGFNVNHSTDWTWSVSGMLSYDFTRWFSISAGYQAVALDESNGGSGVNKNGLDLIFSGVAGGLNLRW